MSIQMQSHCFTNVIAGKMYTIDKGTAFYVKGENPEIKLTSVGKNKAESIANDNEKDIEPLVDYTVRATDFTGGGKGTTVVWWARINNNTLQYFNQPMQNVIYTFDVKEAGEYDIVMSVSTISGSKSDKIFLQLMYTVIFSH